MQAKMSEVDQRLERFVANFVSIFEASLSAYYESLVEQIPKKGKWASLAGRVIDIAKGGVEAPGAITRAPGMAAVQAAEQAGGKVAIASGLAFLGEVVSAIGTFQNRVELKKLIKILEIFQKDRDESRGEVRKNLVEAGVDIFRSFEIQFMAVKANKSWERAMLKLARDAAARVIYFYKKNPEEKFPAASSITKGVILGQSKRYKNTSTGIPHILYKGRTVKDSTGNKLRTGKLFETVSLVKIASQHENYCYKKEGISSKYASQFRLFFQWEERECDLCLTSLIPKKDTINTLPIISSAAYVRIGTQLFYVDKIKEVCTLLKDGSTKSEDKRALESFDRELKIAQLSPSCTTLTNKDLETITSIIGHTHEGNIHWEEDGIVLQENREYKKTQSSVTNVRRELTKDGIEKKQKEILSKIKERDPGLIEERLQKELEKVKKSIIQEIKGELGELEKHIKDIKDTVKATFIEVGKLGEGNEKILELVKHYGQAIELSEQAIERSKDEIIDTIVKATFAILAMLEEIKKKLVEDEQLTPAVVINRLKENLLASMQNKYKIENQNEYDFYTPELYTPLYGCYDMSLCDTDRFNLLEKVIPFVEDSEQETLLILGEAGSGKTVFSEYLTKYLLEHPPSAAGKSFIPIYIRVSNPKIKNIKETLIEDALKDRNSYNLNEKEIRLLLHDCQYSFCFIFDAVDELINKDYSFCNFYHTNEIHEKFPSNHCIFTARKSAFKSSSFETNFEPIQEHKGRLTSRRARTILLAPFNESDKIGYIRNFIENRKLDEAWDCTSAEDIYQRIKNNPNLNEIVGLPILLMMTMSVLPYLEAFYKVKNKEHTAAEIKKDLLHMYTHNLFKRAEHKLAVNQYITEGIGRYKTIYDVILKYSTALAEHMNKFKDNEISEEELFGSDDAFAASSTSSRPDAYQRNPRIDQYKKFFCRTYRKDIYMTEEEYKLFKYGREGCEVLQPRGKPDFFVYAFIHSEFLDYFAMLTDDCLGVRRKEIEDFMDFRKH